MNTEKQQEVDKIKKNLLNMTKEQIINLIENNQGDLYLVIIAISQSLVEIQKPGIQYFAIINIIITISVWFSKNMLKLYSFLYDTTSDHLEEQKMPKHRFVLIQLFKYIQLASISSLGISQIIKEQFQQNTINDYEQEIQSLSD